MVKARKSPRRQHSFSVKSPLFAHRHKESGSSSLGAAQHFFSHVNAPLNTPVKVFSSPKSKHAIASYRLKRNHSSPTGQSVVKAKLRAGTIAGGSRKHHSHSPRRHRSASPRRSPHKSPRHHRFVASQHPRDAKGHFLPKM